MDGLSLLCGHLCSVLTSYFSCSFAYEESVDEVRRVMEKYGPVDSIDMKTGEDEHALRDSHITDNPAPGSSDIPGPHAKALRGRGTAVQYLTTAKEADQRGTAP